MRENSLPCMACPVVPVSGITAPGERCTRMSSSDTDSTPATAFRAISTSSAMVLRQAPRLPDASSQCSRPVNLTSSSSSLILAWVTVWDNSA